MSQQKEYSQLEIQEIISLIKEYDLALQALDIAYYEATSNENCGMSNPYLTDQEILRDKADVLMEEVKNKAIKLGIELSEYKHEKCERISREEYRRISHEEYRRILMKN